MMVDDILKFIGEGKVYIDEIEYAMTEEVRAKVHKIVWELVNNGVLKLHSPCAVSLEDDCKKALNGFKLKEVKGLIKDDKSS